MQVGNFISYGVCKFICLSSFMYNRFHKELRFFFSLLKRKKEAKKEKSSHCTCTTRSSITRRLHINKDPPAGRKGGLSAVTLPFSHLKLGGKVSGDPPQSPGGANRRLVRRNTTLFTLEIGGKVSGDPPQSPGGANRLLLPP